MISSNNVMYVMPIHDGSALAGCEPLSAVRKTIVRQLRCIDKEGEIDWALLDSLDKDDYGG